jgi:virginiamycin B lyase
MRKPLILAFAVAFAGALGDSTPLPAQTSDIKEWPVEWGGRTRDPHVGPDGLVWFVGQAGNYIANLDPTTGALKRFEIEEGTNPHNLIVAPDGFVWYSGNRNGRIGRLDPKTGEVETYLMPDPAVRDPHTLAFDGKGNIWFTAQGASRVGRLNMASGKIDIINPHDTRANPYGIVVDPEGRPWLNLFATNMIATVDPTTLAVTKHAVVPEGGRTRRIAMTPDGMIWWVDYARGFVGRFDPETKQTKEWQAPGGAESRPYAITADDRGRLWFSETGAQKRLVGFDPETEDFFSINEVSGNIRHMMFHKETGTMWYGTDANNIGRAVVGRAVMQ